MPAAAISSSIDVPAKPFASTASSAIASRRSRVSLPLRAVLSSMRDCTFGQPAVHRAHPSLVREPPDADQITDFQTLSIDVAYCTTIPLGAMPAFANVRRDRAPLRPA